MNARALPAPYVARAGLRRSAITILAVAGLLVLAPAGWASPTVSFNITGTAGTNGWFRSNVTIHWTVTEIEKVTSSSGCELGQLVTTEGQTSHKCTVEFVGGSSQATATPKIDKTAPAVAGATPTRAPDSNGWYNRPVGVAFTGSDGVSGIASCATPTYGSADGALVSVAGTCTDMAGNTSAPVGFALNYDATPPSVAAAADRPPDGNGWYRKPLIVSFSGADATSGVEACTQPTRYAGPDMATVGIAGTCRDRAGNTAAANLTANYDSTAPKLAGVGIKLAERNARLSWKKPSDTVLVRIDRTPGINGRKKTRVYKGTGESFVDRTVRKGVRYRYELTATDAAGNLAGTAVTTDATPTLYAPAAGAVVRKPPTLRWESFKGARFYNVQLYRNGVKVLSVWPTKPRLHLPKTWRYRGKKQRLTPGSYRWFVWPALGTRAQPRYGRPLVSSSFVMKGGP